MSSRFLWINMNSSPPNIVLTPENGVRTGRLHCPRPFQRPGFSHFFFQKRPLSPPHRRMEQAPVPRHSAGATGRKTPRTPGRKKAEPPGSGSAFLVIFSCLLGSPLCIQRQRPRPAAAGTQMTISPSASILQCPMQSRYPECSPLCRLPDQSPKKASRKSQRGAFAGSALRRCTPPQCSRPGLSNLPQHVMPPTDLLLGRSGISRGIFLQIRQPRHL